MGIEARGVISVDGESGRCAAGMTWPAADDGRHAVGLTRLAAKDG
jgi:hypothetical protein